jgi:hypothetical protein
MVRTMPITRGAGCVRGGLHFSSLHFQDMPNLEELTAIILIQSTSIVTHFYIVTSTGMNQSQDQQRL